MPIPLITAGIAAVGSIAGGVISSNAANKGAKLASDTALQTADKQIAASNANRDFQYGINQPVINRGNAADERISALLNLGGDTQAARAGFDAYRDSTGYDFRRTEGLDSVNSNAYARGMGNSGATLKALTQYGQGVASQEFGNYLGQVGGVSATGANARGLVAQIGSNAANNQINSLGQAGQISGNALGQGALAQGQIWGGVLQNLAQIGGSALDPTSRLGSSFAPAAAQAPQWTPNYGGMGMTGRGR